MDFPFQWIFFQYAFPFLFCKTKIYSAQIKCNINRINMQSKKKMKSSSHVCITGNGQ